MIDTFLLVGMGGFIGAALGYVLGWRASTRKLDETLMRFRAHDPRSHQRLIAWWRRKDVDGHGK